MLLANSYILQTLLNYPELLFLQVNPGGSLHCQLTICQPVANILTRLERHKTPIQYVLPKLLIVTNNLSVLLIPYWKFRGQLSVHNNLLLYGSRIVIPYPMQQEMLKKLHEGHQGIQICPLSAKISIWWPGIGKQINDTIYKCSTCVRDSRKRKEPHVPSKLPNYPWQKVGTDLFHLNNANYILVVDYYSRFIEVIKLTTTTFKSVIEALHSIFSHYGIPEILISDNGPQYSPNEFAAFAKLYNFHHSTSSPLFPQSNGQAERAVQTVKKLLRRSDDLYMAHLTYCSTPIPWCNFSPSELLMGRCLHTTIPTTTEQLTPA